MDDDAPKVVKIHDVKIDQEYTQWLSEVKARYRNAQIKAAVKVNAEQLLFNWQLGRDLVLICRLPSRNPRVFLRVICGV